ncbi:MAG: hypothetical protein IPL90_11975 [Holophagales bacterium]|nr:hypothetical protein [Holophagales bacterium]
MHETSPLVTEADAVWAGRAEGGHGGHARVAPVRKVLSLLRAELAERPTLDRGPVEAHAGALLRG